MSSNATSNSSEGKKLNRRFERENPTILTSTIREEDVESDENYENEETSDSGDDDVGDDDDVIYIDDDEIDVPALPGKVIIDSEQVAAWQGLFVGDKAVPHALAGESVVRAKQPSRGSNTNRKGMAS